MNVSVCSQGAEQGELPMCVRWQISLTVLCMSLMEGLTVCAQTLEADMAKLSSRVKKSKIKTEPSQNTSG